MLTYTSEMRMAMNDISFTDDDFIEKIIEVGKQFRPFSEAMDAFILDHGYEGDISDVDQKVNFIKNAFKTANMDPPREVKKWYAGQPITRKTGFRICFAFGLDKNQTNDFFRRFFARERGFDCHDIDEAIYYFCLNNGLTFTDAKEIKKQINIVPTPEQKDEEVVYTNVIIEELDNIFSKEELITYLSENAHLFVESNLTAFKMIQKMWNDSVGDNGLLRRERDQKELHSIQDDLAILERMEISTGPNMSYREAYIALLQLDKKQVDILNSKKSIKPILELMHSHVQDCFPSEQGIEKIIRDDHSVEYETIRKWLILLSFYMFWADKAITKKSYYAEPEDRKRCISTINNFLLDAGYSELYEGNPYDWIYFYAIGDDYPLETFRWIWTFLMDKTLGV